MTPSLFVCCVMPDMLVAFATLAALFIPVAGTECWIPLPNRPDSYTSLDVGSIQHMPSGPVSAWVRMEASNRAGMRSLQRMFGTSRSNIADSLYTVDYHNQQFPVSQVKLYQDALIASERQIANDAGWQRIDGVGLAGEVAHRPCGEQHPDVLRRIAAPSLVTLTRTPRPHVPIDPTC